MTAPLGRMNVRRRATLRRAGRRKRNARAPTSVGGRVPRPNVTDTTGAPVGTLPRVLPTRRGQRRHGQSAACVHGRPVTPGAMNQADLWRCRRHRWSRGSSRRNDAFLVSGAEDRRSRSRI